MMNNNGQQQSMMPAGGSSSTGSVGGGGGSQISPAPPLSILPTAVTTVTQQQTTATTITAMTTTTSSSTTTTTIPATSATATATATTTAAAAAPQSTNSNAMVQQQQQQQQQEYSTNGGVMHNHHPIPMIPSGVNNSLTPRAAVASSVSSAGSLNSSSQSGGLIGLRSLEALKFINEALENLYDDYIRNQNEKEFSISTPVERDQLQRAQQQQKKAGGGDGSTGNNRTAVGNNRGNKQQQHQGNSKNAANSRDSHHYQGDSGGGSTGGDRGSGTKIPNVFARGVVFRRLVLRRILPVYFPVIFTIFVVTVEMLYTRLLFPHSSSEFPTVDHRFWFSSSHYSASSSANSAAASASTTTSAITGETAAATGTGTDAEKKVFVFDIGLQKNSTSLPFLLSLVMICIGIAIGLDLLYLWAQTFEIKRRVIYCLGEFPGFSPGFSGVRGLLAGNIFHHTLSLSPATSTSTASKNNNNVNMMNHNSHHNHHHHPAPAAVAVNQQQVAPPGGGGGGGGGAAAAGAGEAITNSSDPSATTAAAVLTHYNKIPSPATATNAAAAGTASTAKVFPSAPSSTALASAPPAPNPQQQQHHHHHTPSSAGAGAGGVVGSSGSNYTTNSGSGSGIVTTTTTTTTVQPYQLPYLPFSNSRGDNHNLHHQSPPPPPPAASPNSTVMNAFLFPTATHTRQNSNNNGPGGVNNSHTTAMTITATPTSFVSHGQQQNQLTETGIGGTAVTPTAGAITGGMPPHHQLFVNTNTNNNITAVATTSSSSTSTKSRSVMISVDTSNYYCNNRIAFGRFVHVWRDGKASVLPKGLLVRGDFYPRYIAQLYSTATTTAGHLMHQHQQQQQQQMMTQRHFNPQAQQLSQSPPSQQSQQLPLSSVTQGVPFSAAGVQQEDFLHANGTVSPSSSAVVASPQQQLPQQQNSKRVGFSNAITLSTTAAAAAVAAATTTATATSSIRRRLHLLPHPDVKKNYINVGDNIAMQNIQQPSHSHSSSSQIVAASQSQHHQQSQNKNNNNQRRGGAGGGQQQDDMNATGHICGLFAAVKYLIYQVPIKLKTIPPPPPGYVYQYPNKPNDHNSSIFYGKGGKKSGARQQQQNKKKRYTKKGKLAAAAAANRGSQRQRKQSLTTMTTTNSAGGTLNNQAAGVGAESSSASSSSTSSDSNSSHSDDDDSSSSEDVDPVYSNHPVLVASTGVQADGTTGKIPAGKDVGSGGALLSRQPRSDSVPSSLPTPTQTMEFFLVRTFAAMWFVLLVILMLMALLHEQLQHTSQSIVSAGGQESGVVAANRWSGFNPFFQHYTFTDRCVIFPVVALLGLLPLNAIAVARFMYVWMPVVLVRNVNAIVRRTEEQESDSDGSSDGSDSSDSDEEGDRRRKKHGRLEEAEFDPDGSAVTVYPWQLRSFTSWRRFRKVLRSHLLRWRKRARHVIGTMRLSGSMREMYFSRNPVLSLASATVVGSVDGESMLTDVVFVPRRVLTMKPDTTAAEDHNKSRQTTHSLSTQVTSHYDAEDQFALPQFLQEQHEAHLRAVRRERRERLKREARFRQLELHRSSSSKDKDCCVTFEFAESRDSVEEIKANLNPLALCALLHSVHSTSGVKPSTLTRPPGWSIPSAHTRAAVDFAQAMDMSVLWGRCMHWLPRALNFADGVACEYRLLRRIYVLDQRLPTVESPHDNENSPGTGDHQGGAAATAAANASSNAQKTPFVHQKCGLLFEKVSDPGGDLQLFVLGSAHLVMASCNACWDGEGVDDMSHLHHAEAQRLTDQWPRDFTSVACSYRILPARYRQYLVPPEKKSRWNTGAQQHQQEQHTQQGSAAHGGMIGQKDGSGSGTTVDERGGHAGAAGDHQTNHGGVGGPSPRIRATSKFTGVVAEDFFIDGSLIYSTHPGGDKNQSKLQRHHRHHRHNNTSRHHNHHHHHRRNTSSYHHATMTMTNADLRRQSGRYRRDFAISKSLQMSQRSIRSVGGGTENQVLGVGGVGTSGGGGVVGGGGGGALLAPGGGHTMGMMMSSNNNKYHSGMLLTVDESGFNTAGNISSGNNREGVGSGAGDDMIGDGGGGLEEAEILFVPPRRPMTPDPQTLSVLSSPVAMMHGAPSFETAPMTPPLNFSGRPLAIKGTLDELHSALADQNQNATISNTQIGGVGGGGGGGFSTNEFSFSPSDHYDGGSGGDGLLLPATRARSDTILCGGGGGELNRSSNSRSNSCTHLPVGSPCSNTEGGAAVGGGGGGKVLLDPAPIAADAEVDPEMAALQAIDTDMTFLGVVGLGDLVRPQVDDAIRTLNDAGVRFVHFAQEDLAAAKSYGNRIGLTEDINTCISLKKDPLFRTSADRSYIRAHLPHGVPQIRRHLMHVDRIPLQVPLFSHSRSCSVRDMISVMQDNHEVVCVAGSIFYHGHARPMLQADISVGLQPHLPHAAALGEEDLVNRQGVGGGAGGSGYYRPDATTSDNMDALGSLISSVCALRLPVTPKPLPVIVNIIRESRHLLRRYATSMEFILQANCALAVLHGMTLLTTGGPLLLTPGQTLWILYFVIPILGFACAYAPMEDVMAVSPQRHCFQIRLEAFSAWCTTFALRYIPTCALLGITGYNQRRIYFEASRDLYAAVVKTHSSLIQQQINENNATVMNAPMSSSSSSFAAASSAVHGDLGLGGGHTFPAHYFELAGQTWVCFALTYLLCWHSLSYLNRHDTTPFCDGSGGGGCLSFGRKESFRGHGKNTTRRTVFQSTGLLLACAFVMVATLIVSVLGLRSMPSNDLRQTNGGATATNPLTIGSYLVTILAFVCWPVIILLIDCPLKSWRARRYDDRQKYLRFVFTTRLGMHSPVGEDENTAMPHHAHTSGAHFQTPTSKLEFGPESGGGGDSVTVGVSHPTGDEGGLNAAAGGDDDDQKLHPRGSTNTKQKPKQQLPKFRIANCARWFFKHWTSVDYGRMETSCVCCPPALYVDGF